VVSIYTPRPSIVPSSSGTHTHSPKYAATAVTHVRLLPFACSHPHRRPQRHQTHTQQQPRAGSQRAVASKRSATFSQQTRHLHTRLRGKNCLQRRVRMVQSAFDTRIVPQHCVYYPSPHLQAHKRPALINPSSRLHSVVTVPVCVCAPIMTKCYGCGLGWMSS
jgi:hypothetical protein